MRLSASLVLGLLLAALGGTGARADDASSARSLALQHSHASFAVSHLYLTRVSGTVPIVSGSVTLAANSTIPTRVEATLDPRRVDSGDRDRDDDLQGPDWFDTKRFPTWTFASTSVGAAKDGAFTVEGTLTVHGVAQSVKLSVTTARGLPHPAYHATARVDRRAFEMRTTAMDGLIGDDVDLTLDVEVQ